jgi:hypothetical protein
VASIAPTLRRLKRRYGFDFISQQTTALKKGYRGLGIYLRLIEKNVPNSGKRKLPCSLLSEGTGVG